MKAIRIVLMLLALPIAVLALDVCQVTTPTASLTVPFVTGSPALNTDPRSATWANASSAWIEKDCTDKLSYPELKTEVRGFWTDTDLYLLFASPYKVLNLWLPADNSKDRLKLWDKDVVEFFLGDDWQNIRHYREFEIAPPAIGSISPSISTTTLTAPNGIPVSNTRAASTKPITSGTPLRKFR